MQNLLTHFRSYIRSELFSDSQISSCHSDKSMVNRGPQPFAEGGVRVWMDGELFKVKESARAAHPIQRPATEILCRLFLEERDLSFLTRLDGIYSAVIYDAAEAKVHLIADRYGLRHLYWTRHRGGLAWGSEVKAMLALPDFRPRIDRVALEEFVRDGYVSENRTWFEDVTLLGPGTTLTWNLRQKELRIEKYWGWKSIRVLTGKIDDVEIADELARLLIKATEIRCRPAERVGTLLSGGLDSRAILAAMPDRNRPIHCVTFGQRECDDMSIAHRAAQVKGAAHHCLEINAENFLKGRAAGVWWTDGQSNLMDLHVAALLPSDRDFFDIVFDGFWGDTIVGGWHIRPNDFNEVYKLNNRGRRFIINGPRFLNTWLECRLPFCDNDLVDLAMSIPREIRGAFQLYQKMLLRNFRPYYEHIPWQYTSLPIHLPRFPSQGWFWEKKWVFKWVLFSVWSRIRSAFQAPSFVEYDSWVKQEPAKSFVDGVLNSKAALYPEFLPSEEVALCWQRHLNGFNHTRQLFTYLTLELWLQQVFLGKHRPHGDTPAEAWTL